MTTLQSIHARLLTVWAALVEDNERGDVPGWVLITMMTAGIAQNVSRSQVGGTSPNGPITCLIRP